MPFFQFVHMGKTPKNLNLFLVAVLFSFLLCFPCCFLGFGHYFSLLVSCPLVILSTIFLFKSTKKKKKPENPSGNLQRNQNVLEKEVKDKVKVKVKEEPHQVVETKNHVESESKPNLETIEDNEIAQQSKEGLGMEEDTPSEGDFSESSEGFELKITPSESDFSESSEGFEIKWQKNFPISESSFSEEEEEDENLIEISLPGSEKSGLENELPYEKGQPNLPDFLPESIFSQKGFLELLADINEMNEEDNLIEIDISVGSIKCPRFEIEA